MQRRREAAGAPSLLPVLQVWESSLPTPTDPKERERDLNPGSDPGRPWRVLGATQPSPRNRSRFRGSGSCPASRAVLKPHEALAQPLPTTGTTGSEGVTVKNYETAVQCCWNHYKDQMDSIEKDWCDWAMISRPYSTLRECLEHFAELFDLGFPNPLAERIIFETHQIHFANCSLVQPTFSDPPEDVLLAMIIAPICLIPFLITLVVWRSKDSEAQA
ncbi:receptor activity-modifying protein 2 isoform X1 [Macaca fascicularis]|uniref:receptor activity-modifying protein 2 isoform X1 n=1 Tax=Macaca mulatta TaxID=9544 RepID=UPI0007329B1D|nr:receptor activity-modifying protein 2 isoform X1 [Macaca mulatta]XP_024645638.1 receptor activity-modifying protein 2 isoform X1 [Macaca nemestrina]XP_045230735.1 receptor activity-modifying protein 2 isoform X1 [Macaca fascicularis]